MFYYWLILLMDDTRSVTVGGMEGQMGSRVYKMFSILPKATC